jgi:glycerol-3-phosphate dehydrogenase (NAD(P)+)
MLTTQAFESMQGVPCPEGLTASTDMAEVVGASEVILMVIPTPFVAATVAPLADLLRDDQILVSCTKGILNDTLETPNEVRGGLGLHAHTLPCEVRRKC